jgi:cobalt/nickel transport system permease protein
LAFAVIRERHIAGASFVHRLDPRVKLGLTVGFVFAALMVPLGHWEVFALLALFPAAGTALSGVSPRIVVGRSLLALPFVLAAVPVIFNRGGDTLFSIPIFGWTATDAGLEHFAAIMFRSWLSVLMASVLTATTESDHLLRAVRSFGVPRLLVSTIAFMWRYVFVIAEEAHRLLRARESRSARVSKESGGSIAWRGRVAGSMVGSLFLRSLDRSERVYLAMQSRGFDGELRLLDRFALRSTDIIVAFTTFALLALVVAYARV